MNVWESADDEQLKALYLSGLSARKVAQVMGLTGGAVSGRLFRLGISRPRQLTDDIAKAIVRRVRRIHVKAEIKPVQPKLAEVVPLPIKGNAKPWETRQRGECAYPIDRADGTYSCCAPTEATYCADHRRIMFIASRPLKFKSDTFMPQRSAR